MQVSKVNHTKDAYLNLLDPKVVVTFYKVDLYQINGCTEEWILSGETIRNVRTARLKCERHPPSEKTVVYTLYNAITHSRRKMKHSLKKTYQGIIKCRYVMDKPY